MRVYTSGVFDILHPGHIEFLRQAKALGTELIVLLNSDKSVKKIKPGRPIFSDHYRKMQLQALRYVDTIVLFDEPTPVNVLNWCTGSEQFIYVKSSEYVNTPLPEEDVVKQNNGQIVFIRELKKFSTSKLIKCLRLKT